MNKLAYIVISILFSTASVPASVVAYWDFEEGAGSTTTVERVSSTTSDATADSWSTGTAAPLSTNAYSLSGTRFGSNLDSAAVGINGSGSKTIMAWINTSAHTSTEGTFFDYSPSAGSGAGQDIRLLVKNGGLRMEVSSGGFEFGSGLSDGNWHMVAFVINANDGINDVDVYIDGTYTTNSGGGTLLATATDSEIGFGADQNGGRGYIGLLDELTIYDEALDEATLDDIMANGVNWSPAAANAPVWQEDPIAGDAGTVGAAYVGTLAGKAVDPNGDPITYSRDASGPAWLVVATNGTLSGTPAAGDIGTNTFSVVASDFVTGSSTATLNIVVSELAEPGLVAYWDFEEGSGSNATEQVSATPGDDFGAGIVWSVDAAAPTSTSSLDFPGTAIGNFGANLSGQDLGIDGTGAKTILGWINTSESPPGSGMMFFGWSPGNGTVAGGDLRLGLDATGDLRFEVSAGFALYDSSPLNDGSWHMVAVVIEANDNVNAVQFYIDGSMVDPTSAGDRLVDTLGTSPGGALRDEIYLGIGNIEGTQQWNGLLDDVAVYNKALTEAELDDVMANGVIPNPAVQVTDLVISGPVSGGASMVLSWTGVEGKTYGVETNADLVAGSWGAYATNIPAAVGAATSITNPIGPDTLFYRVISE